MSDALRDIADLEHAFGHLQVQEVIFTLPSHLNDSELWYSIQTTGSMHGRRTSVFFHASLENDAASSPQRKIIKWDHGHAVAKPPSRHGPLSMVSLRIEPPRDACVKGKIEPCTSFDMIKAVYGDIDYTRMVKPKVDICIPESLKRPVKYFWGVHDFVRGLRGALLGHEYLTRLGILHYDITEDCIALARRPGGERGYLIDTGLLAVQQCDEGDYDCDPYNPPKGQIVTSDYPSVKRGGAKPYLSRNILYSGRRTYHDELESFLYVVLLFFISHTPLSMAQLREADAQGFFPNGRLHHTTRWPKEFAKWATSDIDTIYDAKNYFISRENRLLNDAAFNGSLHANWVPGLHAAIIYLIERCLRLFRLGISPTNPNRSIVTHRQFISVLEDWLEEFSDIEDEFSNCPFV